MGLFDKIFEKKICSICGGEIGLLGNRKLEDGNCCKTCAAKLSPFFSDRRSSTVEEIKQQLEYREANKAEVAKFNTTRVIGGDSTKIYIDENARRFMVTSARNLADANPDVIDFAMVTGCETDISEDREEEKRKDKDGNYVSYMPPRFSCSYDFEFTIFVNHPYFSEINFRLNSSSVQTTPEGGVPAVRIPDPRDNYEYREYEQMGNEIKAILTQARQDARDEIAAANAPKTAATCPYCGATTIPDANGCCEFCGGAMG
ncbi:MAG: DUF4428 domain-containing protein [Oscillospiraceae bacterium]|nr:DUF4428 domain-containing protein [Oscillospiraceae bacterium]